MNLDKPIGLRRVAQYHGGAVGGGQQQFAEAKWEADMPNELPGTFSSALAKEFWRAVSSAGLLTLHVVAHHGRNTHHIIETIFKATARALRSATETDPRATGIPSTKGVL